MATANGEKAPHSNTGGALISDARLRELYATMLKCRILEERLQAFPAIVNHRGEQRTAAGHEAPIVGSALDLRQGDCVSSFRNDPRLMLLEGEPVDRALRLQSANQNAETKKDAQEPAARVEMLPLVDSVDAQLQIAAGVALAQKLRKSENLVVTFLPPGTRVQDLLSKTTQFVTRNRLPLIVVATEVNGSGPKHAANGFGVPAQPDEIPVIPVDGNDVVAVYRVRQEAMARARRGGGPTLIDCKAGIVRIPPNHARKSAIHASEDDPIANMAAYLTAKRLFDEGWSRSIAADFTREVDGALKQIQASTSRSGKRRKSR